MTPDLWLIVLCIFGLLVALGATSGVVNHLLWVSEPLACVLAGVALGPFGFGLLHLDAAAKPLHAQILQEAARLTLAIAVTAAAMRLPRHWLRMNWRRMAVSLLPGMLLMTLAGAFVGAATLGAAAAALPDPGCGHRAH